MTKTSRRSKRRQSARPKNVARAAQGAERIVHGGKWVRVGQAQAESARARLAAPVLGPGLTLLREPANEACFSTPSGIAWQPSQWLLDLVYLDTLVELRLELSIHTPVGIPAEDGPGPDEFQRLLREIRPALMQQGYLLNRVTKVADAPTEFGA